MPLIERYDDLGRYYRPEDERTTPLTYGEVLSMYIDREGPVAVMGPSESADDDATLLQVCHLMSELQSDLVYVVEPRRNGNSLGRWRVGEGVAPGYGNLDRYVGQLTALQGVGIPLSPIVWQEQAGTIQHTHFSDGFLTTIVDHATSFFVAQRLGDGHPMLILQNVFFEYARCLQLAGA